MNKNLIAISAILYSLSFNCYPAIADTSTVAASSTASSGASSSSGGGGSSSSNPVTMAAGMVAGFAVGWPVCLVRRLKRDAIQGARGIAGETDNPILLGTAGAIWLPLAFCTSFLEAPVYAARNSFMAEKPFSKDQFSLGDMPDYD